MIAFAVGFLAGFIVCAMLTSSAFEAMRDVTASLRSMGLNINPPTTTPRPAGGPGATGRPAIWKGGVNRTYQIKQRPPRPEPIPRG